MESISSALENVASDKGRICGSLNYLRSNIANTVERINEFKDHGGIKILVKCLKQVNPKVLSLTLSILGNCSMYEACREQLFAYGVIKDLGYIMKNINVDAIDNRTCRMIANLAASQTHIPVMYKHNIPTIIVTILSNTKCDATRYSAIRALRKIWENSSKIGCAEMIKCKAVGAVSELLKSKCKHIVIAVLRAQVSFLSNSCNLKHPTNNTFVVLQILGKEGESENIINLLLNLLPEQPLVGKIIYLMCKVPHVRVQLGQSQLIVRIIEILKRENNHYLAVSMCLLLECPLNRSRFACTEDGIGIFLNLISGTNSSQKELAINTLSNFQYCKDSLKKMVKRGLIPMLVTNLSSYIQENKITHPCPFEAKTQSLDTTTSFVSCASPARSSSMSPNNSTRTDWTPPKEDNIATDSYSPCYSPVCESFDNESINADESKSDVSDYEDDKCIETPTPEKMAGEINIIHFLTYLSYVENVPKIMAVKGVWETILNYILYAKDGCPNAIKILQNITQDVLNLKTILTDGYILKTHQRLCRPIHELEICKYCKIQNNVGAEIIKNSVTVFESKFAEAMIINIMKEPLTTTNQSLKILVSVTIPLVIQCDHKQLITMLSRYKVFDNLCNIIKDDQNTSFDDAIGALMALFKTSNIIYSKSEIKYCENKNCHKRIVKKETTVMFALDDGAIVNANKSFLSIKSPMFEAMFRCGGFKEAYQKTIRLNDVSSECFKSFLLLLELYCDCLLPKKIDVLLELIMITDKYMLNELSEKISSVMIDSISIDDCSAIFEWAKDTGYRLNFASDVGTDVVRYLFSSNSKFPDRVEAIKKICRSKHKQTFIEDLSSILKHGLSSICGDKISEFYLSKFACELD